MQSTLTLIVSLITIIGVPPAIYVFFRNIIKERKAREYATYNALDDKYIDFLKLCLDNPRLNIYNVPVNINTNLSDDEKKQQLIIFEILISIFERAFLMYKNTSEKIRNEQWKGWDDYIKDWIESTYFQEAWEVLGTQWEEEFTKYMNNNLKK
jgi:hypothetical protein